MFSFFLLRTTSTFFTHIGSGGMARRSLRQSSGAAGGLAARYEARYEVLGHIGSGSFGSVHLVRYKGGYKGQEGAVRVRSTAVVKIAELSNMKSEAKQQAKDEVVRLAELNHPNIVGYYESFLLDNRLHIIMEYANGGTLEARINQARVKQAAGGAGARLGVEDAKVKKWFAELLLAVGYIHHKHLIHRDIKPANVFLHNDAVKLGDFGVTRELDNTLAMAKTQAGTPFYMGPEQLSGEGYNCCADVWALGCVLYELLTTRKAFPAKSIMQLCIKVNNVDYEPLDGSVDACFRELLPRMLCKDTSARITIRDAQAMPWVEAVFDAHAGPKKPVTPSSRKNPQSGHASGTPSTPSTPKPPSVILPPPALPPPALPSESSKAVVAPPLLPKMKIRLRLEHGSGAGPSGAATAAATAAAAVPPAAAPITPARNIRKSAPQTATTHDHRRDGDHGDYDEDDEDDDVEDLTKSMQHRMNIGNNQDQLKKSMARIGLQALRDGYSAGKKKKKKTTRTPSINNHQKMASAPQKTRDDTAAIAATVRPGAGVAKLSMFGSSTLSSERFGMGTEHRLSLEGTFGAHGANPFAAHRDAADAADADSASTRSDVSPEHLRRASELFPSSEAVRQIRSVSLTPSTSSLSSSNSSDAELDGADTSDENDSRNTPGVLSVANESSSGGGGAGASKSGAVPTAAASASAAAAARRGSSRKQNNRQSSLGGCDVAIVFKEADSSKGTPERFSVDYRRSTGKGLLRASSGAGLAPPPVVRSLPISELNLDDLAL